MTIFKGFTMKKYKVTVRKCVYYYAEVEMQSDGATDDDVYEDAFIATDALDDAVFVEDDDGFEIIGVQDIDTGRHISLYEVVV
jgi:hypothetical protein